MDVGEAVEEVAKRKCPRKAPRMENAMVCNTYSTAPYWAAVGAVFQHFYLFLTKSDDVTILLFIYIYIYIYIIYIYIYI